LEEPIPKPPARILCVGSSNCGKTNALLNLISRQWLDNKGNSIFDEIYVMSPTARTDEAYTAVLSDPKFSDRTYLTTELDTGLIEDLMNREKDNKNILVYLDDFCSSKKELQQKAIFDLYFHSRHSNITSICVSQYFFQVPSAVRGNCSHLLLFPLKRNSELILIRTELSSPKFHDEIFDELIKEAHEKTPENQFPFLLIDMNKQKFYKMGGNSEPEELLIQNASAEERPEQKLQPIKEQKEDEENEDVIEQEIQKEIALKTAKRER
jgi:GTPase SAR1 family protein